MAGVGGPGGVGGQGAVREPEPLDRRPAATGLVRPGGVVLHHPRIQRGLQVLDRGEHPVMPVKNSARIVLCSRSTFPVVVGEYGAVNRCRIPLSVQIRSNITGPGPRPNRPVNTFPLSVRICSGTPCRPNASASAWHTGRAVARPTTLAQTTNREWSSMPVTTLISAPSARWTRPITSICHNSIDRPRSQRR